MAISPDETCYAVNSLASDHHSIPRVRRLSQSSCPSPPVKLDLPELVFKHHSTTRSKSSSYIRVVSLRFVTSSSVLLRLNDGSLSPEQLLLPDPPDPPDCTSIEILQPLSPYVRVIVQPTPPFDAAPLYENRTTRSTHPEHGLTGSGGLCVTEASLYPVSSHLNSVNRWSCILSAKSTPSNLLI
ncbi:hypothetical protein Rs2_21588 [Raphanus sativus]|nr:hypothetical protein Rs2_21588 [Raphanus sativus]